jgi:large subunit ribosomal protein L29
MKSKELRQMTNEELSEKLKSLKVELFNLRFSNATGGLKNPIAINVTKKDIARVETILRERTLGAKAE